MAKKRKTARTGKVVRTKPRRRPAKRGASGDTDPMNIVAAVLVVILIGLGIYFYQASQKTASTTSPAPAAVAAETK